LKPYLGSTIRELPPKSQIYLAARLDLELPKELWIQAEDEDWILYASRIAIQKVELQRPLDALEVLKERNYLWETESLRAVLQKVAFAAFHDFAREYEHIRDTQKGGSARTARMTALVSRVIATCRAILLERSYAESLFSEGNQGARVVALAIAQAYPYPEHLDIAIAAIRKALSPFEQFQALQLARRTLDHSTASQRHALREALLFQEGTPIHASDPSRVRPKEDLLQRLADAERDASDERAKT
jgi:hypothetical protein